MPPKVRMFASKLASNALASNCTKKARHIIKDDNCTICGQEPYKIQHMQLWFGHVLELSLQKFGRNGINGNRPIAKCGLVFVNP